MKIVDIPKWLNTKQALCVLKELDYPLSRWGLFKFAKRNGFLRKEKKNIRNKLFFDRDELFKCVQRIKEAPPVGWVSLKSLVEKYNKKYMTIYKRLVRNDVKMIKINKIIYVQKEVALRFIND